MQHTSSSSDAHLAVRTSLVVAHRTAHTCTGHEVGEEHVEVLREAWADGQRVCVPAIPTDVAPEAVMQRYGQLQTLQQKRLAARRHKTSYCYDFPAVFASALRGVWEAHAKATGAVQPHGALVFGWCVGCVWSASTVSHGRACLQTPSYAIVYIHICCVSITQP